MPFEQTIQRVRHALRLSSEEMKQRLALPQDVRLFVPASGGHSIEQLLEHVSALNGYFLIVLRKWSDVAIARAIAGAKAAEEESDLDALDAIGPDEQFGWMPHHRFWQGQGNGTRFAFLSNLPNRQFDGCLTLLDRLDNGVGSLCQLRMKVGAVGHMDLYQLLYLLARHALAHVPEMAQLEQLCLQSGPPQPSVVVAKANDRPRDIVVDPFVDARLTLESPGPARFALILLVKEIWNVSLIEARRRVDEGILAESWGLHNAQAAKKRLEALGARVREEIIPPTAAGVRDGSR